MARKSGRQLLFVEDPSAGARGAARDVNAAMLIALATREYPLAEKLQPRLGETATHLPAQKRWDEQRVRHVEGATVDDPDDDIRRQQLLQEKGFDMSQAIGHEQLNGQLPDARMPQRP